MTSTSPSAAAPTSVLRLLCVGTGRDGTQSLTHMIRKLLEDAGRPGTVAHEYRSREFFHAFASFKETGDRKWLKDIEALIDECPHECIVGNGYAPVLDMFAALLAPAVPGSRSTWQPDRCHSKPHQELRVFPRGVWLLRRHPAATVKRMTAFHYGEVSRGAWQQLPLPERIAWYFDKTHSLIAESAHLFSRHVQFDTERLNDEATRKLLAELVLGDSGTPATPMHLNAHVNFDWLREERRHKLQWLLGQLNYYQVAHDDVYPLEYFTNAFVAWTGYQIRQAPQIGPEDYKSPAEIAASLDRAERALTKHLEDVASLKAMLADANLQGGKAPK